MVDGCLHVWSAIYFYLKWTVPLQKFFRRKTARDLLPVKPVEITIEAWWVVQSGYITEDDIKVLQCSWRLWFWLNTHSSWKQTSLCVFHTKTGWRLELYNNAVMEIETGTGRSGIILCWYILLSSSFVLCVTYGAEVALCQQNWELKHVLLCFIGNKQQNMPS